MSSACGPSLARRADRHEIGAELLLVSAATREGVPEIVNALARLVEDARRS